MAGIEEQPPIPDSVNRCRGGPGWGGAGITRGLSFFFFFFRLVFNQNYRIPLLLAGGPEGKEEEMRSSSSLGTKENAAKANCLLSVIENSRSTLGRKSNPLISCNLADKTVRKQRIKPQEIFCSGGAEQRVTLPRWLSDWNDWRATCHSQHFTPEALIKPRGRGRSGQEPECPAAFRISQRPVKVTCSWEDRKQEAERTYREFQV